MSNKNDKDFLDDEFDSEQLERIDRLKERASELRAVK